MVCGDARFVGGSGNRIYMGAAHNSVDIELRRAASQDFRIATYSGGWNTALQIVGTTTNICGNMNTHGVIDVTPTNSGKLRANTCVQISGGGGWLSGCSGPSLWVCANQNPPASFQSPNANTWVDIKSTAGTWSMGALASGQFGLYNRHGSACTQFFADTAGIACARTQFKAPIVCATSCVRTPIVCSTGVIRIGSAAGTTNTCPIAMKQTSVHQYLMIESTGTYEAMTHYYNPTAASWYTGIRNTDTTTAFHVYTSAGTGDALRIHTNKTLESLGIITAATCVSSPILCATSCVKASTCMRSPHIATSCVGMGELTVLGFCSGGQVDLGLQHYSIYRGQCGWSGVYPDLIINYHTGIRYGAEHAYQGHRFFCGSSAAHTAAGPCTAGLLFSIGKGDLHTRVHCGNFDSCNIVCTPHVCASATVCSPMVCATSHFAGDKSYVSSCVQIASTVICQHGGVGRLKFCGSGVNHTAIGPHDDNGWAYFESTNNANGWYMNTNQGGFSFDTGHLKGYTDGEVDVGVSGNRFRCGYFSDKITLPIVNATSCVCSPVLCVSTKACIINSAASNALEVCGCTTLGSGGMPQTSKAFEAAELIMQALVLTQSTGEQTQLVALTIGKVILSLKYPHLNLLPETPTSTSPSV
jgi:hypothetical protein